MWPFRRHRHPQGDPLNTRPAFVPDQVEGSPPHRFSFWLADAANREVAEAALERLVTDGEIDLNMRPEPEGRVRIEVDSTFSPRTAAILRPLHTLRHAGIVVRGFEALDLVREIDDRALAGAVDAWKTFGNKGPHRHRLEVLAGEETIARCLGHLRRQRKRPEASSRAAEWRFAAGCAAFNTEGAEAHMLAEAVRAENKHDALGFIDAAVDRAILASLSGAQFEVVEEHLMILIRKSSYISERAAYLAQTMPGPLPGGVVEALAATSRARGEMGLRALEALRNASPSAAVRQTVDDALRSDDASIQASALGVLAHHWGTGARPVWQRFLTARSAPLRYAAEESLGLYGEAGDLADAAAHLARLARSKSSVQYSPPRGADIVNLLVRHRDDPSARAALNDLSARWEQLGEDLRQWLGEHHPWLAPHPPSGRPLEVDAEPEPPLEWPPPSVERDGDTFVVSFDRTDLFETRERFEELAESRHDIELIDGDREWTTMRIAADDPEALIRRLWEAAHRRPPSQPTIGNGE